LAATVSRLAATPAGRGRLDRANEFRYVRELGFGMADPSESMAVAPAPEDLEAGRDRLGYHSVWSLAGLSFSVLAQFALTIVLARFLTGRELGLYALGIGVLQVLGLVLSLGPDQALLRFVPAFRARQEYNLARKLIGWVLAVGAAASLGMAVGLFISADWLAQRVFGKPDAADVLRIVAVALAPTTLLTLAGRSLHAQLRIVARVLIDNVLVRGLLVIAISTAMVAGLRLRGAMWGYTVVMAAGAAAAGACLVRVLRRQPRCGGGVLAGGSVVRFALVALVVHLAMFLVCWTDTLLVGVFRPEQELGRYHVALRVSLLLTLPWTATNAAFTPLIAAMYTRADRAQLAGLYQQATRWTVTLALALLLPVAVVPGAVLAIFGAEYTQAAPALIVLAMGQTLSAAAGCAVYLLTLTGRQGVMAIHATGALLVNLVLNVVLIRRLGIVGAALATTATGVLIHAGAMLLVRRTLGLQPYTSAYWKPLLGFAVMVAALWTVSHSGLVSSTGPAALAAGVAASVGYMVLVAGLGFEPADKKQWQELLARLRRTAGDQER